MAVDSSGEAVVAGQTGASTFPVTSQAYDKFWNGNFDCFITRLSASGNTLVFSTYLGGASGDCEVGGKHREAGVALDASGAVFISGPTYSSNFPTVSAYDSTLDGGGSNDAFLAKLSADGSNLVYSTYLGGPQDDCALGCDVALDSGGIAYIVGGTSSTAGFPVTTGADDTSHNGGIDAFVVKIAADGNPPIYGTYYGGSAEDLAKSVAVHDGRAVVAGQSMSSDLPTAGQPYQTTLSGTRDAFLAVVAPDGSDLTYATYLGGGGDEVGDGVGASLDGKALILGFTTSGNFPVTSGAYDISHNGNTDGFVARVDLPPAPEPTFEPQPYVPDPAHPHAVSEVQRASGTDIYDYDASGNVTSRTEAGVAYNQTTNAEGSLTSVTNTGTSETWAFTYEGDGNRVRQVNPDGTSTLLLAGGLYEVTLSAGGQQTGVRKYYAIAGQRIAMSDATGIYFLLTDHLGSVVAVTDATAALVYEQRYRPFGQPRLSATGAPTDFGFTGQRGLGSAGLQDFNARWFDTSLGAFASADPLIPDPFNPQALNRYGYVLNSPLRFTDPTGMYVFEEEPTDRYVSASNPQVRYAAQTDQTRVRLPNIPRPQPSGQRGGVQEGTGSPIPVPQTGAPAPESAAPSLMDQPWTFVEWVVDQANWGLRTPEVVSPPIETGVGSFRVFYQIGILSDSPGKLFTMTNRDIGLGALEVALLDPTITYLPPSPHLKFLESTLGISLSDLSPMRLGVQAETIAHVAGYAAVQEFGIEFDLHRDRAYLLGTAVAVSTIEYSWPIVVRWITADGPKLVPSP